MRYDASVLKTPHFRVQSDASNLKLKLCAVGAVVMYLVQMLVVMVELMYVIGSDAGDAGNARDVYVCGMLCMVCDVCINY